MRAVLRGLILLAIVTAAAPAMAGVRDDYRACTRDTFTRLKPGADAAATTAQEQYCLALGYNFG
jgi:hypothetical protein